MRGCYSELCDATPAELLVEHRATFAVMLDRTTARTVGLTMPLTLLGQATAVIA